MGGIPALIYQVIWQRVLKLYFGVDIESTAVIVASFMLGLGLGALIGGRLADRSARPGLIYAAVEGALGVFGLLSLSLISFVGGKLAGAGPAIVFLVTFALLLIPTTLMGMTLPLVSRAVVSQERTIGRHFAWLYAANTLGAALGALLTAYLLKGLLGLRGATFVAAGINFLLPLLIYRTGLRAVATPAPPESAPVAPVAAAQSRAAARHDDRLNLPFFALLAFLSGFTALGYELVWYRLLGCLLHGTIYVFGTILAVYLIGIGWGSLASRKTIDRGDNAARFARCQLGIAAYTLLLFVLLAFGAGWPGLRHLIAASFFTSFHPAPELAAGHIDAMSLYSIFGLVFWTTIVVLPPTWLMGYGFPNLVRGASHSLDCIGRSLSFIVLANIVGATLGSLAAGFFGLHYLGSERTLWSFALLSVLTAGLAFWRSPRANAVRSAASNSARRRILPRVCGAVALAGLCLFPGPGRIISAFHYVASGPVQFIAREDRTGVVALRRQEKPISFSQVERVCRAWRLYIDGSSHGSFPAGLEDIDFDRPLQIALAAHRAPRRALVIGLGDGVICATIARDPRIHEVVIVELNNALRDVLMHSAQGRAIFENPAKIRYVVDDGRRWLLANPDEQFDLVAMFPLHAAHAYYGNLYSVEFFQIAQHHLHDDGLFYTITVDPFSTARTLAQTFRDVVRIGPSAYAASDQPLVFDLAQLPSGVPDLADLIEADRAEILDKTATAPLNLDFWPRSEYYLSYPFARYIAPRLQSAPPYRMTDPPKPRRWRA